jgi:N-acetylglucosaminyldiphosphoundecaprenol N-acetyl-beta-D-mannosaminyltransferase
MVKVLDVSFYDKDMQTAIREVVSKVTGSEWAYPICISATGAHGVIEASKSNAFKTVLNEFYINLPDGVPCVWVGRLKGANTMQRCYGPDFFKETMISTAGLSIKHFFCGGKPGVAEELVEISRQQFNNCQVTGVFSPPFREMSDEEMDILGQQIQSSEARIIWIGISTPKQELFANRLAKYIDTGAIITVGAAFDFHTGKVRQAPVWMQNMGLEWFFRLLIEPRRLYKRYFEIVPMFIYLNIKEFLHFYINKRSDK